LDDDVVGAAARSLYADAQAMLKTIVAEKWFVAKGVAGIFPAQSDGDDIVVYEDEDRTTELARFHTLRQQMIKSKANLALSDFVAPRGFDDWIGAFAVTSGHGEAERSKAYKDAGDDYNAIMVQSLADRLAEAFAEWLHAKTRREIWGYGAQETLSHDDILLEKYQGIRPAPGYPAQPDHTEKWTLFSLLGATEKTGIGLTESLAMWPGSSVSGLYFAHPQAHYFGVGRIDEDQLKDYCERKSWSLAEGRKWLAPLLND